jgi:hypothetical protein
MYSLRKHLSNNLRCTQSTPTITSCNSSKCDFLQTSTSYCGGSRTVHTQTKRNFIAKRNKCVWSVSPVRIPCSCHYTKFTFASRYWSLSVRTKLVTRLHIQQFRACRNGDAATPVGCESLAEEFLGDIAHLAAIWTGFSSFSTYLLRVLLLPKTEPVARSVFTYLQIWTFSC